MALLSIAVAAALVFTTASYHIAPAAGRAELGNASHSLVIDQPDPPQLAAMVEVARDWFGMVETIGHTDVAVPGAADPIDYRAMATDGPFSGPMLDIHEGRHPSGPLEVALTTGVAQRLRHQIGDRLVLDGTARTIVGIVENPSNLLDDFVLTVPGAVAPDEVQILVRASNDRVREFQPAGARISGIRARGESVDDLSALAAVASLTISSFGIAFVGLIASASLVVLAQRRRRQLGLLGAIGATERELRLVTLASGAMLGAIGAIGGIALGLPGWLAVEPMFEQAAAQRIDRWAIPWWIVTVVAMLAIAGATAASWWPARLAARVSSVAALAERPSPPSPVRRSVGLGALLGAAGIILLGAAGDLADETAVHVVDVLLVGVGTVSLTAGVLMLCPLVIRTLAAAAGPLPLATRLAWRDLGRYQARAGAALAAVTLALAIPAAVVMAAAAAQPTAATGNLSPRQLVVRTAGTEGPFVPPVARVERFDAAVDELAATVEQGNVISLQVAVDPTAEPVPGVPDTPALSLASRFGDGWRDLSLLYVATPEVLGLHGIDPTMIDADIEMITTESGDLRIAGAGSPAALPRALQITTGYSSLPGTLVTPEHVAAQGWRAVPAGHWVIESSATIDAEEQTVAIERAAASGLTIESRDARAGLATLRSAATAVGLVVALAILALTIGLIRSEAAADVRTLTATGATSGMRRRLTAATAGALAGLGVVLGAAAAAIAMAAGPFVDSNAFARPAAGHLALLVVGTPLAATLLGWAFSGREPTQLGRRLLP